eukprot:scaffold248563_cov111-Cyclotella_meneghiniana.AAC.1
MILPWPQNEIMRTVLFRSVQSVFGVGGLGLVGCRSIFQSLAGENRGSTINDQRFLSFDLLSSSAHVHTSVLTRRTCDENEKARSRSEGDTRTTPGFLFDLLRSLARFSENISAHLRKHTQTKPTQPLIYRA